MRCEVKCMDAADKQEIILNDLQDSYRYPRLNATSITEFLSLIQEKVRLLAPNHKDFRIFQTEPATYRHGSLSVSHARPFGSEYKDKSQRNGFSFEFTCTDTGFSSNIPERFGLYVNCGNGTRDGMMRYNGAYCFLDDLPKIKEIMAQNEVERALFAVKVHAMNETYRAALEVDQKVKDNLAEIDAAYDKYRALQVAAINYRVENYHKPAAIEFSIIPAPTFINIEGTIQKFNVSPPSSFKG